ncbi:MAG: DUF342 domain-containing protein, partial [Pseudomonadales bacterium]|nr:DUF342 domain-containing protein [Pseudomonadales bacterium]
KNQESFEIEVAVKSDASISVKVSEDKLTAYADFDVAYGGDNIDKACVIKTIAASKISHGAIKEQLVQLIKSLNTIAGPCTWVIARGSIPIRGQDSQFVNLVEPPKVEFVESEDDKVHAVNMRDVGEIPGVKVGQKLMRLEPAQQGICGKNVYGESIAAEPGESFEYVTELEGVEIHPEDNSVLLATIDGMPVPVERGITVQQTYNVRKVNVNTGDVRFQGNVCVKEDVEAGASISCSGNIIIGGMVVGAQLKAGGDISITGGVIGEFPEQDINEEFVDEHLPWRCRLEARGSITTTYVNSALLKAQKSIVVKEYTSHSVLSSGDEITVGQKKTSSIIGGRTTAKMRINLQNIGNDVGVKTLVEVGEVKRRDPLLKMMKNDLADKMALVAKYKHVLQVSETKTSDEAKEKRDRVITALKKVEEDIGQITIQIEEIIQKQALEKHPKILVTNQIFTAVSVVVCGQRENYSRVKPGGELLLKDEKFFHDMK